MKHITIDCTGITEPSQLHAALANKLSFPDWYGNNLDALFDCLSDIYEDTTVHFIGWNSLGFWKEGFTATFSDAQAENCYFRYQGL